MGAFLCLYMSRGYGKISRLVLARSAKGAMKQPYNPAIPQLISKSYLFFSELAFS